MVMPDLTTTIYFAGATGCITAYMAFKRDRNPYLWFGVGAFFGLLGAIALYFAPKVEKPEEKVSLSPVKREPQPYLYGPIGSFWYYAEGGNQIGPMSYDVISKEWKTGKLPNGTLVWHEDLSEWTQIEELVKTR